MNQPNIGRTTPIERHELNDALSASGYDLRGISDTKTIIVFSYSDILLHTSAYKRADEIRQAAKEASLFCVHVGVRGGAYGLDRSNHAFGFALCLPKTDRASIGEATRLGQVMTGGRMFRVNGQAVPAVV